VSVFRRKPEPRKPAPREREPHPDARVEAELQRVLALQRAVRRTEARLEDIGREQQKVSDERRADVSRSRPNDRPLAALACELREERLRLEAGLAPLHDEVSKRLADLGDYALYLYAPPEYPK
jgi:hypothetical protein